MTEAEQSAVVRDWQHFHGWHESEPGMEDAAQIYVSAKAVERSMHMSGVTEYLKYAGLA